MNGLDAAAVFVLQMISGAYLIFRTKRRAYAQGLNDAAATPRRSTDPYRTSAATPQAPARVYYIDCRFKAISESNNPICLAQPDGGGGYIFCGEERTNKNNDCVHFQQKDKR